MAVHSTLTAKIKPGSLLFQAFIKIEKWISVLKRVINILVKFMEKNDGNRNKQNKRDVS